MGIPWDPNCSRSHAHLSQTAYYTVLRRSAWKTSILCGNISTHHTLVRQGAKFLSSVFSLSGYGYLGDDGTDGRKILHDGTCRSRTGFLRFFWEGGHCPQGIPKIRNFATKFWPFEREYLEVEALYVN